MTQVPNFRGPIGLKDTTPRRDPCHLRRVRHLPCCICEAWGMAQLTATEAHHPISGRFSRRKAADRDAIPLCADHHRGGHGRISVHLDRHAFDELFGPDTDWIAGTLDKLSGDTTE